MDPSPKWLTYNEGEDVRNGKVCQVHIGGRPEYDLYINLSSRQYDCFYIHDCPLLSLSLPHILVAEDDNACWEITENSNNEEDTVEYSERDEGLQIDLKGAWKEWRSLKGFSSCILCSEATVKSQLGTILVMKTLLLEKY